ncbi:hypothetical protein DSECCO2_408490 [anaerobic digester metagenome]
MGFYQIAFDVEGFTVGQLKEMLADLHDDHLLLPVSTESPFSEDIRYIRVLSRQENGIYTPIGILAPENDRMITQEEIEGDLFDEDDCRCEDEQ